MDQETIKKYCQFEMKLYLTISASNILVVPFMFKWGGGWVNYISHCVGDDGVPRITCRIYSSR